VKGKGAGELSPILPVSHHSIAADVSNGSRRTVDSGFADGALALISKPDTFSSTFHFKNRK
jgi:hypothetical protein